MTQSIDLMWFSIDAVTMDIADVRTFCYHNDLFTQEITVFTQDLLRKLEWKKVKMPLYRHFDLLIYSGITPSKNEVIEETEI